MAALNRPQAEQKSSRHRPPRTFPLVIKISNCTAKWEKRQPLEAALVPRVTAGARLGEEEPGAQPQPQDGASRPTPGGKAPAGKSPPGAAAPDLGTALYPEEGKTQHRGTAPGAAGLGFASSIRATWARPGFFNNNNKKTEQRARAAELLLGIAASGNGPGPSVLAPALPKSARGRQDAAEVLRRGEPRRRDSTASSRESSTSRWKQVWFASFKSLFLYQSSFQRISLYR